MLPCKSIYLWIIHTTGSPRHSFMVNLHFGTSQQQDTLDQTADGNISNTCVTKLGDLNKKTKSLAHVYNKKIYTIGTYMS